MSVNTSLSGEQQREKRRARTAILPKPQRAGKMLQRTASNVSDKSKSSKPKVGENMSKI